MDKNTKEFIRSLTSHTLRKQIINLVNNTHDRVKYDVIDAGIRIYPEGHDRENEVIAGEIISSEQLDLFHFYEELNYIKNGLSKGWVPVLFDDRYNQIRQEVESIFNKLK